MSWLDDFAGIPHDAGSRVHPPCGSPGRQLFRGQCRFQVAPRNVHLDVTARRSEAMLSFGIAILGSPLLNLGPVVPDRPLFLPGFIPARRTKTSIMPTLELADRQAQYFGRGVPVDAHRLSV